MTRAKQREAWDHTASLMALIATCHRDAKRRRKPYTPQDFHPDYVSRKKNQEFVGKGFAREVFLAFSQ